ncbi:PREDICTED: uncharacterized protein LOC104588590 [Nelumbo nucifera]|uniref:Uncharacterized protein LOC104588590 n=1 Tax=Nelumbo nucifera TaxID=4432 RepID=A0A1U7ZAU6_NELNU|nr:PREDICTED: uncharacterized protein LOC104588590 [Nelumbo nucifera]
MGKSVGKKKKKQVGGKSGEENVKQSKAGQPSSKAYDNDTVIFIAMSQELKDEGNKLFQRRDHEGALLKYEKALRLLPRSHIDVAHLRSNMAACYMQMGIDEYPRAINECNLALEVSPNYSKALLKRARCYEALNRLDLAFRDAGAVLNKEPNNLMALEIAARVKKMLEKSSVWMDDEGVVLAPKQIEEPPCAPTPGRLVKEKGKKKSDKVVEKKVEDEVVVEKKVEDKVVVEETVCNTKEKEPPRTVKLVLGEDIRWAQLPAKCSILQARDVIRKRFSSSKSFLIKYKDKEGDLVTITTTEGLRWAEASAEPHDAVRLYIVEVSPQQEPLLDGVGNGKVYRLERNKDNVLDNGSLGKVGEIERGSFYMNDWIAQFSQLFKNHVGFDSNAYLDLHELGTKLCSEAMEDTVTSEEAQDIFDTSEKKFQEMAALALFNWGNVHMSKARKRVFLTEDASRESVFAQVKIAYEWAQKEYVRAGKRYEEALMIKPDFFEGHLALGQQQFEQAKLSWCYAIGTKANLETWPSAEVLNLYNNAEDNMERGFQMWEQMEEQRLNKISKQNKVRVQLQKMGLDGPFKDISAEADEQAANMRSQINLLWGKILYERSIVEFKLGLPVWKECLEVAVEKFELAGASPTDIAIMIKNHCSIGTAVEGLGFKIDEIIQAWNEMYDAKRWQSGIPSFHLEPLFRRRVPNIHHILESM